MHRFAPGRVVRRCALATLLLSALPGPSVAVRNSLVEEFDTTAFRDPVNTTAFWNTAGGRLQLFPVVPTPLGTHDTPGTASGVVVSGIVAYVADGPSGLRLVDVANPTAPVLLGSYDTPGDARDVAVAGTVAYVADGPAGLRVIDVSDPTNPVPLGSYDTPGDAWSVTVSGTIAYVADGAAGLQIIGVGDPMAPSPLGSHDTPGDARDVAVAGTVAYVADGPSGLRIVDVADPASPVLLGAHDTPDVAQGVALSGTVAYVADGTSGLQVIAVGNPGSPALLGSQDTPGVARGVAIPGVVALVADDASGLQLVDVSNPASPAIVIGDDTPGTARGVAVSGVVACVADGDAGMRLLDIAGTARAAPLGSYDTPNVARDIALAGTVAYVADGLSGLVILDVGDPAGPTLLGTHDTPGTASDVVVSGAVAYVADGTSGLRMVDVGDPANPAPLGAYDTPGFAEGVAVSGTRAYVADGQLGLKILDVANPASPALLGFASTLGVARAVVVSGSLAFVADDAAGLTILDVGNPALAYPIGNYDTPGAAQAVALWGRLAFVADGSAGLRILDLSDPMDPVLVGAFDTPGSAADVVVSGSTAYVADGSGGLVVVDVSDPANPAQIASLDTPDIALGVAVSGAIVHVADGSSGLRIAGVTLDRYQLALDTGRSLPVDATSDSIRRARLTTSQQNTVSWELSAGGTWQAVAPGAGWVTLTDSGTDLLWRTTLSFADPAATAPPPEVSRLELEWLYEFPVIRSVTDVGNDQGGRVRVRFTRADNDFADQVLRPVTGYQIYHRVDDPGLVSRIVDAAATSPVADGTWPGAASLPPVRRLGDRTFVLGDGSSSGSLPAGVWEAVAWVAATQSDSYLALVPTTADSTDAGVAWSVFLVTAHTTTPSVWYAGHPDSGYSIDNLAPNVPTGLIVTHQSGVGSQLDWDPPVDPDVRYFRIYRSNVPGFIPGPSNLVHTATATSWTDSSHTGGPVHYQLSAVDFAGNESATTSGGVAVGAEPPTAPVRFALHAPAPNPSAGEIVIRFDVPSPGAEVHIGVHDVGGRLVLPLVAGRQPPGARSVVWDGRDRLGRALPTGMYIVRMRAQGFERQRKLVRTR